MHSVAEPLAIASPLRAPQAGQRTPAAFLDNKAVEAEASLSLSTTVLPKHRCGQRVAPSLSVVLAESKESGERRREAEGAAAAAG